MTEVKESFSFEELSESAKARALDKHRDWSVCDNDWWDCVYEDAKAVGKCLGIEIKDLAFSGFCSQGDGCWIKAHYEPEAGKNPLEEIKQYAAQDTELHRIAEALATFQVTARLVNGITVGADMTNKWETQQAIECFLIGQNSNPFYDDSPPPELARALKDILEDFPKWIYRQLEAEYEHLTEDKTIEDLLVDSGLRFTEDGDTL